MTFYSWQSASGGDFNTASNWHNGPETDIPGAGDDVFINVVGTITTAGQSVNSLQLGSNSTMTGGLSATTINGGGTLDGGIYNATTVSQMVFAGGKLTADTVDGGDLTGGKVRAGTLKNFNIDGAEVKADEIANAGGKIVGGSLDISALVLQDSSSLLTTGGSVTADTFELVGTGPGLNGMDVAAGTVTVVGAATFVGSQAFLNVGKDTISFSGVTGGRLNLQGGFTLTALTGGSPNSLTTWTGGMTTVAGAVLVDMVNAHVQNSGLVVDGGTMRSTGTMTLGQTAQGDLNVLDSGKASVNTLVAGDGAGASGDIVVTGDGSTLTVKKSITVGEKGVGSLNANNGGNVDAGEVVVAGEGAPTGGNKDDTTGFHTQHISSISVGTGSDMTFDALTLGEAGYAQASVIGILTVTGDSTVAEEEDSEGRAFVNGGSWETEGSLTVGSAGKARVDVGANGVLLADGDLTLGEEKGGSGQIVLGDGTAGDGPGKLTVGGDLTIGGGGTGTLLSDLSTVVLGGGKITLGEEKGSKGTLTLHGGSLTTRGEIVVGEAGTGTVIFNQGARLEAATGNHAADLTLGEKFGGTGTATFDGKGTVATVADIEDGVLGKGSLKITNGAKLTAASADLATQVNTNANGVTIDTAGTFIVNGDLSVGEQGFGTLSIKGSGQAVVSGEVAVAEDEGSIGSATISGAVTRNGKTTASGLAYGTLSVGEGGSGTLTISKGAEVAQIKGGEGAVEIGAEKGATGKLTLMDKGSSLAGESLSVGGTEEKAGGKGSLSVSGEAEATFNAATIWKSGSVALNGGTLHLTGAVEGNGAIMIGKAGTLILDGEDKSVGIGFAAGSTGATLALADADLLHATVKGFAEGDSIAIGGLDAQAAIKVAAKGANTVVTILDHGKQEGSLTLAGHYGKADLDLSAAGVLTTTGAKSVAEADPQAALSETVKHVNPDADGADNASHFFRHASDHASETGMTASHDALVIDLMHEANLSDTEFLF